MLDMLRYRGYLDTVTGRIEVVDTPFTLPPREPFKKEIILEMDTRNPSMINV